MPQTSSPDLAAPPANRRSALPPNLPPRGLSRPEAAAYVGVSAGTFDDMVRRGHMPEPKAINTRRVWDRLELDQAFYELPQRTGTGESENVDPWAMSE